MNRMLQRIQSKWSSTDPRDRLFGFVGKIFVEGGVATLISGTIAGLIYVLDHFLSQIEIFTGPIGIAAVFGPALIFIGNKAFCNIILEED